MLWSHDTFDEEAVQWSLKAYEWLFENFGGFERFQQQTLVTPTKDFLPFTPHQSHEFAVVVFETVKSYMGLETWICDLQDMAVESDEFNLLHGEAERFHTKETLADGLFEQDSLGRTRIYYRNELLNNPFRLANVLAHELAHYMISSTVTDPPGGWKAEEFLADFTAIFRGFGIFVVNQAEPYRREQDEDSWGYASRSQMVYGLAIFCRLAEIPMKAVKKYLKWDAYGTLKEAFRDLKSREAELDKIRNTVPIPDRD